MYVVEMKNISNSFKLGLILNSPKSKNKSSNLFSNPLNPNAI